jgi:hypothetical protein
MSVGLDFWMLAAKSQTVFGFFDHREITAFYTKLFIGSFIF